MTWIEILLPSIVAVIAAGLMNGVAWYLRKAERVRLEAEGGKLTAEASDTVSGASIRMVERWETRVEDLEAELGRQREDFQAELGRQRAELQGEIDGLNQRLEVVEAENVELSELNAKLTRGAMRLTSQLRAHELEPVWSFGDPGA